jgi:amino acid transporter/nucleotide-binding universal stress UspA family protein
MKPAHTTDIQVEAVLHRDLGLTTALAIGVGTMIAAGIFTLSGLAIRNVGSAAILSFLMAAGVALLTALTYCEFTSIYPESGEGYLYARRTFRPIFAYFVGWALVLGYTSSCAFYIASLSSYFTEFIWKAPYECAAGIAALLILTLLNIKGTKESGHFQVAVTAGKVALLIWFVVGGLSSVRIDEIAEKFSTDWVKIFGTASMVFITFFGFSAIAASAGEVRDPVRTIPRAIFISMGMVTFLYALVVLVIIAANLSEYSEAAMGNAARLFLGPIGGIVIVAGAIFSMVSAANASIMAGSRVVLSMSRFGHFPRDFGAVNPRTRTPITSLVLVGGAILVFAVSLPLEELAHFADTVLLLALVLVNAALIVHRRKYPNLKRPFRVPLVPLLPALGIVANLYLLVQISHHAAPMAMAGACLVLGVLGFVAWRGYKAGEITLPGVPSRVALERSTATDAGRFRVLVPLANPANVRPLIDLAAAVAAERQGEIVALRVVVVPEQLPPSREDSIVEREKHVLEVAQAAAAQHGVPITSLLRIGHDPARAILETASQRHCDLILLGWKGYTSTARKILGEVVDTVVNHARTDIMLVKHVGDEPLRHFLMPTAGGEHARCAEQYVASLARAQRGSITVCSVAPEHTAEQDLGGFTRRLDDAVERMRKDDGLELQTEVIRHKSVSVGVLQEAKKHDAVVVGAAGGSIYPQILFGTIPEAIAKRANRTVILVKHYHPVKALIGQVLGEEAEQEA